MTEKINNELMEILSKEIESVIENFAKKSIEKNSPHNIYGIIGNALYRNAASFSLKYAKSHCEYVSEENEPRPEQLLKICKEVYEDFFTLNEHKIINHILKTRITIGVVTENEEL